MRKMKKAWGGGFNPLRGFFMISTGSEAFHAGAGHRGFNPLRGFFMISTIWFQCSWMAVRCHVSILSEDFLWFLLRDGFFTHESRSGVSILSEDFLWFLLRFGRLCWRCWSCRFQSSPRIFYDFYNLEDRNMGFKRDSFNPLREEGKTRLRFFVTTS